MSGCSLRRAGSVSKVLVAAGDPGGAAAVAPVMFGLHGLGYRLACVAREPAHTMFHSSGICSPVQREGSLAEVEDIMLDTLRTHHPDAVLLGTSAVHGVETALLRSARRLDVPTICVLDSWTNYLQRFQVPGEADLPAAHLPDVLTVTDEFAAAEITAAGIPSDILRVAGQPAFDEWIEETAAPGWSELRLDVRRALRVDDSEKVVVFFSQALDLDYGSPGSPRYRGYDQHSALRALRNALGSLPGTVLAVKPHPRELSAPYEQMKARAGERISVVPSFDAKSLTAGADLVVSMTSVTLVQAVLAGKPVISLQPGLVVEDACILGRMGVIRPVLEETRLPDTIEVALASASSDIVGKLPATWTDGGATKRVMREVERLMVNG